MIRNVQFLYFLDVQTLSSCAFFQQMFFINFFTQLTLVQLSIADILLFIQRRWLFIFLWVLQFHNIYSSFFWSESLDLVQSPCLFTRWKFPKVCILNSKKSTQNFVYICFFFIFARSFFISFLGFQVEIGIMFCMFLLVDFFINYWEFKPNFKVKNSLLTKRLWVFFP